MNFSEHLKAFDAYLAYGYLTNKSVVELVHRRSYANIAGVRKPLSDNLAVETALGDKGILCLNDLSHEIFNVGPNFNDALKMLCTFKLSAPVGNYEKSVLGINDKVEEKGGFLGDEMESFLEKIL
jgi:large subunit ribosomal protein L7e